MRRCAALPAIFTALAVLLPAAGGASPDGTADGHGAALTVAAAPATSGYERLTVGRDVAGEREAATGRHRTDQCPGTGRLTYRFAGAGGGRPLSEWPPTPVASAAERGRPDAPRSPPPSR